MEIAESVLEAPDLSFRRPWAAAIDRAIGAVVEPAAAFLVLVEVVILAAGVFTRYVVHHPLDWTDELATILLLWLAMLAETARRPRDDRLRRYLDLRAGVDASEPHLF